LYNLYKKGRFIHKVNKNHNIIKQKLGLVFILIIRPEYADYILLRTKTKPYRLLNIYRNISKYNKEPRFNISVSIIAKNIPRIRYTNSLRI
jgi:hypothetical protein